VLASASFVCNSSDPEGIHQLRVAIRRMRAAFSIFHGAMPESYRPRLAVKLQTFARKLGAARDWDVLVRRDDCEHADQTTKAAVHAKLIRVAQAKRAEGDRSAHASLRESQCTGDLLQLAFWTSANSAPMGRCHRKGSGSRTFLLARR
jgi:CHAD domain-containing protein